MLWQRKGEVELGSGSNFRILMLRFLGGEPWGWFGLLGLREEGTGRLDSGDLRGKGALIPGYLETGTYD